MTITAMPMGSSRSARVLPITPSTYYEHVAQQQDLTRLSARTREDLILKPEVAHVFTESSVRHGVRKVWRQMMREGFVIARCTVERLMHETGLDGVIRGKPVLTTISDKAAPCPRDHVNHQFSAPASNRLGCRASPMLRLGQRWSTLASSSIPTPDGS